MLSKTTEIDGNTIVVRCNELLEMQADWLIDLLHKLWHQGVVIEDGKSIQVGWSLLRFHRDSSGVLMVCEPDYSKNPFKDIRDDISCTLQVQESQNSLTKSIHTESLPALFHEKIILAKGCLNDPHIYLERNIDAPKGDSGWYIGPCTSNDKKADLEAIYVCDLVKLRPPVLKCLALPPGYLIVFQGDEIEAILDANNKNILVQSDL